MSEPVQITLPSGGARPAILDQICAGGARVQISEPLRPGNVIDLDFNIGGVGGHHRVAAQVVHARKGERGFQFLCGLRFVGIALQEHNQIAAFVEEEQNRRRVGFLIPCN